MNVRGELRNFFVTRVLEGSPTMSNTDRAVNNLITELQPFLDHLVMKLTSINDGYVKFVVFF